MWDFYEMFHYPKSIPVAISMVAYLFAQVEPMPDWAKLTIQAACVATIAYITIYTFPQMFRDQIASQAKANEHFALQIDKIIAAHEVKNQILARKIDYQTETLHKAITGKPIPPECKPKETT